MGSERRASCFIGLMSGTSLDGVDAVVADFSRPSPLLAATCIPYDGALRDELAALQAPGPNEVERAAEATVVLMRAYAQAAGTAMSMAGIDAGAVEAIGCHGQTIRHRPARGYTVQLMNGALLAELAGIAVACDFRSRDVAAGGQGAPLVPAFHAATMRHASIGRAIVNIGGIANVTCLPAVEPADHLSTHLAILGFDTGPGNALLDDWIALHRPGVRMDESGDWAASGKVDTALLARLLSHPYFSQPAPKSTGRETFNMTWVRGVLAATEVPHDVQATLLELTARSIAQAVEGACPHAAEVYVCGGGTHNQALMLRLATLCAPRSVASTAALGMDPDWVEATAFAWLARELVAGRSGNLCGVTGARGPRVLGCLYPR